MILHCIGITRFKNRYTGSRNWPKTLGRRNVFNIFFSDFPENCSLKVSKLRLKVPVPHDLEKAFGGFAHWENV